MPDLDVVTANGPLRTFSLLHDARPVLLNLGEPGDVALGREKIGFSRSMPSTVGLGRFRPQRRP